MLNGLALCGGGGGLELGLQLALGERYRCVAYVEREAYAAATLVARMQDESLDEAPVWDDLQTFDGRPWRGVVDLVSAGFPCQPFSNAGQRRGTGDERWLWPYIARVLGEVRPSLVFLENVTELATARRGGIEQVLGDLARLGFDAEWDCVSAASVGAPHGRDRLFLLAYPGYGARSAELREQQEERPALFGGRCEGLGNSHGEGLEGHSEHGTRERITGQTGTHVENPDGRLSTRRRCFSRELDRSRSHGQPARSSTELGDSDGERWNQAERWKSPLSRPFPPGRESWDEWREVIAERPDLEPAIRGMADGTARRVDRLRVAGNGVVPLAAALAFLALAARIERRIAA